MRREGIREEEGKGLREIEESSIEVKMGGAAMKNLIQKIGDKNEREEMWDLSNFSAPVKWYQTESGFISTISIGHLRTSKTVQPKQRKRWTSINPVRYTSENQI